MNHLLSENQIKLLKENLAVFKKFFLMLNEKFDIYLVGGFVRDFFIYNKFGKDLDFEIHFNQNSILKKLDLNLEWSNFKKLLEEEFENVEALNFKILKIKYENYDLEISPPRKEKFEENKIAHKNFNADFFSNLELSESGARRDLSINAIYLKINILNHQIHSLDIYDPFNGLSDINNQTLNICSENFYKDPVRPLRAIRFQTILGFKFSKDLILQCEKSNILNASSYYFRYEIEKSKDPFVFINNLIQLYHDLPSFFYEISKNKSKLEEIYKISKEKEVFKKLIWSLLLHKKISLKVKSNFLEFFKIENKFLMNFKNNTTLKLSQKLKIEIEKSFDLMDLKVLTLLKDKTIIEFK